MFTHILAPLDGSLLAERAISHAEQFARVFGGKITLLQILDPSQNHEGPLAVEPLNWQIRKAEAEMYLQETAAKIRANGIEVDHILREGRASENIIDFAHGENIDLVVLTTHGASGLSRWNTSSVVSKVLEKLYLPILLVRAYQAAGSDIFGSGENDAARQPSAPQETGEAGASISAVDQKMVDQQVISPSLYQRILLPIDTSRRAECALPAATALARGEKGEQVTILLGAVINPPDLPIPAPYPDEIRQLIDRFMQLSRAAVERYVKDLAQRLQLTCETSIVENENISVALHELVEQENIDLVVLCAHGQTGGTNWPYGSVARNYLEHGTRTVLVIQDVPLQQVHPTAAELAAEKYGRR
jgi:nucleotide-binding universal stress UspA family protein